MLQAGNNLGFQLSFHIGFASAFVASFFIIFYIKERVSKAKLLQFVSGINVVMYWLTAFLWDYLLYIFIAFCITATIGAFQQDGFSTFEELGRTFMILLCFGFAVLPVVYVSAIFFSAPATGFTKMSIIFIFLGVAMYTVVFSMKFDGFNLKHVATTLTWIFLAVPHFALSQSFTNLNMINIATQVCDRQCEQLGICNRTQLCELVPQCCSEY
jgi:ATP-binding cassette subfamily A (ABC1) protein 3